MELRSKNNLMNAIPTINGKSQTNRTLFTKMDYFYNNIISIEKFDSNLLKLGKKSYKNIDIYYIGYITIKKIGNYENKS